MSHAFGRFPHGCACLPTEVWKLYVFFHILFAFSSLKRNNFLFCSLVVSKAEAFNSGWYGNGEEEVGLRSIILTDQETYPFIEFSFREQNVFYHFRLISLSLDWNIDICFLNCPEDKQVRADTGHSSSFLRTKSLK